MPEPPVIPVTVLLKGEHDEAENVVQPSAKEVSEPAPLSEVRKSVKPVAWTNKSFASLLRAKTESASSSNPKSFPTSSQTGFSVPANLEIDTNLTPRQHSNLLQLLSSGTILHSPPPSTGSHIHPRGLVNTGNMCFANVVLQVLLYSLPFWRLFSELGKYIGNGPVVGSGALKDGKGTPLADAMSVLGKYLELPKLIQLLHRVAFLNEFKPPVESAKQATELTSSAPDAAKEKVHTHSKRDSFVAAQFYAALRTKSRFDAMRNGHQEDAEEFLGFLLDTLHEELLALSTQFGGNNVRASNAGPSTPQEEEEAGADEDEWKEVGKKNRTMVTRTVSRVTKIQTFGS